jgi:hypothetical protein
MQVLFQNVLNFIADVKHSNSPYLCGLLLHEGRKSCASMARGLNVPVKQIYNSFKGAAEKIASIQLSLTSLASKIRTDDEYRVFVIDGTSLVKSFAKNIDHLSVDYDGVIRRVARGLSIMVAGVVTGGNIIPVDFSFWHNKKKSKKSGKKKRKATKVVDRNYKTKITLAIELIIAWKDIIAFSYIALDGAFASEKMIDFMEKEFLKYSMRMPRSRKVMINGIETKISDHPALRLIRNERCRAAKGFYKGLACTFIVHKRKKRGGGLETIYIVSNMELSAKDHVAAYNRRWTIDKSFRTMKQYLGLKDCQMLKGIRQSLHIFNAFLAYSIATMEKIASRKKSVEDVLKELRRSKKIQNFSENSD